jgi:hypothetical protein
MVNEPPATDAVPPPVKLKDPVLAAFLAWLIPGLGHWYQGRRQKAVLFFVCILGIFAYGVYLGGSKKLGFGRAVYFAFNKQEWRLHYLCQVWVGLPALPALVQAMRESNDREAFWEFMAPPREVPPGVNPEEKNRGRATIDRLQSELAPFFDFATAFTMIAGLLNILAIYDAYAGPVILLPKKKQNKPPPGEDAPAKVALPENAPS